MSEADAMRRQASVQVSTRKSAARGGIVTMCHALARTLLNGPATVNPILSRVTACCMLLLVLSPFTAPFRTCDLAALFGATPAQHVPLNRPGPATLNIDSAVANIPALTRAGRVRLIEVSTTSGASGLAVRSATAHKRPAAMSGSARERLMSTTILRV
jgi:hypothetical protein